MVDAGELDEDMNSNISTIDHGSSADLYRKAQVCMKGVY